MLVTMLFHFSIDELRPTTAVFTELERSVRSRLKAMSRQELFSFLDGQPPCR
jgi:hypothetical protein